jgi:hypothetical protein
MEWLIANAFNVVMSTAALGGGVAFAWNLDNRLKNIEKEQSETKNLVVTSARLEERLTSLYNIVISQGRRLDRVVERVYGRKTQEEAEYPPL